MDENKTQLLENLEAIIKVYENRIHAKTNEILILKKDIGLLNDSLKNTVKKRDELLNDKRGE